MSKRIFVLLIVLMSLSLIGIIFVQAYYIKRVIDNERQRFEQSTKVVLANVSNTIEKNELNPYYEKYKNLDSEKRLDTATVSQLFIYQQNKSTNETFVYRQNVLEENYKLSSSLFDIGLDSIDIKNIIGNSKIEVYKSSDLDDKDFNGSAPIFDYVYNDRLKEAERELFDKTFKGYTKTIPIHKRISKEEIDSLLSRKFNEYGIDIPYEFAIYSRDLATKVHSDGFENNKNSTFKIAVFYDENNKSNYELIVNFQDDKKFILSSVLGMIFLSIIFTSVIIFTFSGALYQLLKQRKISEIKTDFINNMTHEFKTPIATINLALDAIKNPKTIEDRDKVLRYLNMIKEENKRMHAQVENVLRISKLEKNELNISKDKVDLHELIEDAITHVELIVEDRQGYIKTHFDATETSVLANETHFTNVIVNILDNAIKYSPNAPKIDVYTENVGTNIIVKVKDQGSGMSKAATKRVFEKFYREHTGNIHNVKGHGLGLAYVKRIVHDHQGYVGVESEKEKGSTFIIKLPLIS
ncbi:HAMP domain-containing histidine kinase [Flavobacteriaceae bacterium XHP0103]|uniref:sensor histidine kinase n=1 Tax=Marixanthotalea marina TaxID=2844359 RepID=UPI002989D85A|nr:HAMP domain-containing sensor histidine kinase [Marixanthotalea marina]MBU3822574.1 HAMP domain-containing histidine kinase [Marixanthotalea marina]